MVYRYSVDNPIMEKPLNPHFFSGFVQSDGSFHIGLEKDSTAKHKIRIKPSFYVTQLNSKDKKISPVLRMARNLLQVGHYIPDRKKNCSSLCVNTLKDKALPSNTILFRKTSGKPWKTFGKGWKTFLFIVSFQRYRILSFSPLFPEKGQGQVKIPTVFLLQSCCLSKHLFIGSTP